MKKHLTILAAIVGLCSLSRADTILLSDDFSGSPIDAAKWTTLGPGTVTQGGGVATTTERGILATVNDFTAPYTISGSFTMLDGLEHFNVAFRSALVTVAPFHELAGMFVSFSNDGNQISIQRYTSPVDVDFLAVRNYTLTTGLTYDFSIFDDGYNVSLDINGVTQLATASAYSTGNKIALYSREFGAGTNIDAVTITEGGTLGVPVPQVDIPSVPETSTTILYVGLAVLGLMVTGRRIRRVGV